MKGNKGKRKPKEWLNLTHPKTGEEIRCQVLLNMDLVAIDHAAQGGEEQLRGEEAWSGGADKLTKPKRPPTSFNPWNPMGWVRFLIYKYKYKVYCCCCCTLLIAILVLFLRFYVLG